MFLEVSAHDTSVRNPRSLILNARLDNLTS
jgi:hypothetical protein